MNIYFKFTNNIAFAENMAAKEKHKSVLEELPGIDPGAADNVNSVEKYKLTRQKLPNVSVFVEHILQGNISYLSRAITLVESTSDNHKELASKILEKCLPYANNSIRIGITGVPGSGKSTFIEAFGKHLTGIGKKVAVLAIDPSSSLNKGSILGDKTRMEELVNDKNAYIRPSPSAGSLGGVARKTRETIILCEAAGFDTIIVETVGVGQSETAVHSMVDFFLLLQLAGAGDELQGIKRGILEMADVLVINKADGDNIKSAKIAKNEFKRALHMFPPKDNGWQPEIIICSALENKNIDTVWHLTEKYIQQVKSNNYFENKRNEQNKFWVLDTINEHLKTTFYSNTTVKKELPVILRKVEQLKITPFEAAASLLDLYHKKSGH